MPHKLLINALLSFPRVRLSPGPHAMFISAPNFFAPLPADRPNFVASFTAAAGAISSALPASPVPNEIHPRALAAFSSLPVASIKVPAAPLATEMAPRVVTPMAVTPLAVRAAKLPTAIAAKAGAAAPKLATTAAMPRAVPTPASTQVHQACPSGSTRLTGSPPQ
ncbi:hypothetical protein D3C78_1341740 [compost metagenome]